MSQTEHREGIRDKINNKTYDPGSGGVYLILPIIEHRSGVKAWLTSVRIRQLRKNLGHLTSILKFSRLKIMSNSMVSFLHLNTKEDNCS